VVRRSGVEVTTYPIRAENLASRVRLAREALTAPDGGARAPPGILEGLFRVLIEPAASSGALSGAERLVLVPHGILSYLPFAALRDPASGEYLVHDFSLVQLASAGVLPALRTRASGPEHLEVASAWAPIPDRLPRSRAEVEAVARVLGGARQVVGSEATEVSLRRALARPGIVHLATHGVMNARSPLFSRVELFPGEGDTGDDGRLELHELLEMNVAADLVFLSGCETALGPAGSTRFDPGEDFATLAQSFLVAGADDVVATLWRVEDASAAALAESFYVALQDVDPVEALTRAQRELSSRPGLSDPFHWAAYVVSGAGASGS